MVVVLRYFEAQGRAQPLRHLLADSGVPFEDVRVTIGTWPAHREDGSFAGWFASLPTLTWGSDAVAEALPIATYLCKRLGHYDGLGDAAVAKLEAVVSCCYQDILTRVGETIWADVIYPGADLAAAVPRILKRALDKLHRIDALLPAAPPRPASGAWLGGSRPTAADYFVAEAYGLARYVLGPAREAALAKWLPAVSAHAEQLQSRPALQQQALTRPPHFSANPAERAAVDRLRSFDWSSLGF